MSVESICLKYRGHHKIRRLEFLAAAAPEQGPTALEAAAAAAKTETLDSATYRRLARAVDHAWIEETERNAAAKQSLLDKELVLLSNSNMRDSIRV